METKKLMWRQSILITIPNKTSAFKDLAIISIFKKIRCFYLLTIKKIRKNDWTGIKYPLKTCKGKK